MLFHLSHQRAPRPNDQRNANRASTPPTQRRVVCEPGVGAFFATLPRYCSSHVRRASRRGTRSTYNRRASARGGGGDRSKSNKRFLNRGDQVKGGRQSSQSEQRVTKSFRFRPSYIGYVCAGAGGGGPFYFLTWLSCEVVRWITQCIWRQRNFV
ncbi:hypothetical protein BC826DRAFT_701619 [Russula brevipes]|nr:hypothetical protein BC826DRAFT_701619 [Russula brevipes]